MEAGPAEDLAGTPFAVYRRELEELQAAQHRERQRDRRLGFAKLAMVVLIAAMAILLLRDPRALTLVLLAIAAFAMLAWLHDKVLRLIRDRARTIAFYERGLARMEDRWAGTGQTGERFLDPAHPYARDLDIFGEASVFELLCTTSTRAGEEVLARWLLAAAPIDEIRMRQAAVAELRGRVKLRERLASLGETVGVHPEALAAWGERASEVGSPGIRMLTAVLAAFWAASMACWAAWGWGGFALTMTLVNLGYSHHLHSRLDQAAEAIETAAKDLKLLAAVLRLMEEETFASAKMAELQGRLRQEEMAASAAVRRLGRITGSLESRRNPFARVLDVFTFWSAQLIFQAERWQRSFGPSIREWLNAVGEMEALAALAAFAYEHPEDAFPELLEDGPAFVGVGFGHPLLPAARVTRNDLDLGDGVQLMILSGPNMAGKSTFIRSVGVNAVLALCGATVRARKLSVSPLQVAASICILDSLKGGTSRFYAEINRVKLIADLARRGPPVLFLLDELLSGTNSHERLTGTQFVVGSLLAAGAMGIVSTHDLALARIPERLGARAVNCHFEDSLEAGKLVFDYKLKPGVVRTSNALELMRSIGLGVPEGAGEQ